MDPRGRVAERVRAWALALVAGFLFAGCGTSADDRPVVVELQELATDHDVHEGRIVTVRGVVRTYHEPRHHWLEDAAQHRVELVPQEVVADHLGDTIEVTGRFTLRDDEGRRIAVDELRVLDVGGDNDPG